MPRTLTPTNVLNNISAGLTHNANEVAGDTVNGHFFTWGPRKLLYVRNTDASPRAVTFKTNDQLATPFASPDKAVTVTNAEQWIFGPFPRSYVQPDGTVWFDVAHAGLTSVAIEVGE